MTTDRKDTVADIQEARSQRKTVNVHDTRDIREVLIGQMLEDIDKVVTQLESVSASIGQTYENSLDKLVEHEKKAENRIISAAGKSAADMARSIRSEYSDARKHLELIASQTREAAYLVHRGIWRLAIVAGVMGFVGGGASVVALAEIYSRLNQ